MVAELTWYFVLGFMSEDMRKVFGVVLRSVAEDLNSWWRLTG